ncbi:YfhO family protein [Dyella sp. A6]|uniref:YfhO family protein n=1 Tax=Dyella aluminiiresistens TaxID=3069105 RepID=UPI002E786F7D|nr:YfhO family protein [Dyella sp. A6]
MNYLVKGKTPQAAPWSPPSGYVLVFSGKTTDVWRNTRAYPRLLTPVRATITAPGNAPAPRTFAETNFRNLLWLTPRDDADARTAQVAATTCIGRIRVLSAQAKPTRITVETQGNAPGWLVLGDIDFPGWQADVDGTTTPIHRANTMFQAVCVPAGNHTVTFAFHPWHMVALAMRQAFHQRGNRFL